MNIGFALCGSFCTFSRVFPIMEQLSQEHTVFPIFSHNTYTIDSRFGTAKEHIEKAAQICGREPIHTIAQAEPIGPKKMLDVLVIAPCTGNTLAKLSLGITDGAVTMAAKAHLRADRPLLIALASNDAMSQNLANLSRLLMRKSVYFVPMRQDDPVGKPHSLVADMSAVPEAYAAMLRGKQIRPMFT